MNCAVTKMDRGITKAWLVRGQNLPEDVFTANVKQHYTKYSWLIGIVKEPFFMPWPWSSRSAHCHCCLLALITLSPILSLIRHATAASEIWRVKPIHHNHCFKALGNPTIDFALCQPQCNLSMLWMRFLITGAIFSTSNNHMQSRKVGEVILLSNMLSTGIYCIHKVRNSGVRSDGNRPPHSIIMQISVWTIDWWLLY